MQSGVSLMSNSWLQLYVGVLFIAMVTFAPAGLTGIILEHAPIARAGLLRRLDAALCARSGPLGLIMLLGFVGLVELLSFLTIGLAQGKHLALFGHAARHVSTASLPWLISRGESVFGGGGFWLTRRSQGGSNTSGTA